MDTLLNNFFTDKFVPCSGKVKKQKPTLPVSSDDESTIGSVPVLSGYDSPDYAVTGDPIVDQYSRSELVDHDHLRFDGRHAQAYCLRLRLLDQKYGFELAQQVRKSRANRFKNRELYSRNKFVPTSGMMNQDDSSLEKHENVYDAAGPIEHAGHALPRHVPNTGTDLEALHIAQFLERPVSVFEDSWLAGRHTNVEIDVWDIWSKEPAVRGKLLNYAYITMDLNIRITISATPFHYGQVIASYQPYSAINEVLGGYRNRLAAGDTVSVTSGPFPNYLSQSEFVAYMNLGDNEPVEMHIPFVSPQQAYRLFNTSTSVITNSTSFTDLAMAGSLFLTNINPVTVANDDAAAPATVNVYVWASNVKLTGATNTNVTITATSGAMAAEDTEYTQPGPMESLATGVADVSNVLADVPVISAGAKATHWIASKAMQVFKVFGWSYPVILDKATFVKNNPFSNTATYEGNSTAYRMTLDPKNELTIDNSFSGTKITDELSIAHICDHYTFFFARRWASTDDPLEDVILSWPVSPIIASTSVNDGMTTVQPTRLSLAASCFKHWHGSITYKVEVVCSKFHRGRLLIGFEPNIAQSNLTGNTFTLNRQNSVIIDIQETQVVEYTVEFISSKAFLRIDIPGMTSGTSRYQGNVTAIPVNQEVASGFVYMTPLTRLVQPTVNSSVFVNVSIKSSDMTFALPQNEVPNPRRSFVATSGSIAVDAVMTGATDNDLTSSYFGEKVNSLRVLLKRYTGVGTQWVDNSTGNRNVITSIATNFYGRSPYGVGNASNPEISMIQYLTPCYMAVRGSTRHILRQCTSHIIRPTDYVLVNRFEISNALGYSFQTAATASNSNAQKTTLGGSQIYHLDSNGGVEVEAAYMSPNLFDFGFAANGGSQKGVGLGLDNDYMGTSGQLIQATWSCTGAGDSSTFHTMWDTMVGEDFVLSRFIGCPPHYIGSPV